MVVFGAATRVDVAVGAAWVGASGRVRSTTLGREFTRIVGRLHTSYAGVLRATPPASLSASNEGLEHGVRCGGLVGRAVPRVDGAVACSAGAGRGDRWRKVFSGEETAEQVNLTQYPQESRMNARVQKAQRRIARGSESLVDGPRHGRVTVGEVLEGAYGRSRERNSQCRSVWPFRRIRPPLTVAGPGNRPSPCRRAKIQGNLRFRPADANWRCCRDPRQEYKRSTDRDSDRASFV